MKRKIFAFLLSLLTVSLLQAQTWDGSSSTDWNTPANWSTNAIPTPASTVTIPNTANKPVLANNVTVTAFNMSAGSALDFNGFMLTASGNLDISGATLNNSNGATDIVITITSAGGGGSNYFGSSTINDNITLNYNGTGTSYEGYTNGNTFNGNIIFNLNGTGRLYTCYHQKSTFNGNLTVNRTVAGITDLLTPIQCDNGNFSYTNNAGGDNYINSGNNVSGPISGTVNITTAGAGNPEFWLRKIKNLTNGGSVSVQNSGRVFIDNDTLLLTAFDVNGFTGGSTDELRKNVITGNVTFSEAATNTGSVYAGENIINGTASFTTNAVNTWYEGYTGGDTFNGNTNFNLNGTGRLYTCYHQKSTFNGNLTVNRTVAGITDLFNSGFNAINGNFSYTNNTGGDNYINSGNNASGPISGTVNITTAGAGNPEFWLRKIKNLTNGGSVSVQNSGRVFIDNDTLLLAAFNVNGFTGGSTDELRKNVITGNVTFSEAAANTGDVYAGENIINGTASFTTNAVNTWYEGYTNGNTFNGNIIFNLNGTGRLYTCYHQKSTFNGNLTVNRTVAGITDLFNSGFNAINGNFSYTNNAGGHTYINGGNIASAPINGIINITAAGAGNPDFYFRKIKNLTTGGTISVQNSGYVFIDNDTLTLAAMNVNGFTGGSTDELRKNVITGNVTFSEAATNTGSVYAGENIINGTASFTTNAASTWYEGYTGGNRFNGNTNFTLNGTGRLYTCYHDKSIFTGNLTVSRTTAGITDLFNSGFTGITGNFSYTNNAGGHTYINSSNVASGPINGIINITAAGAGNPDFYFRKIKNLTTGGTISVQNSGYVFIDNDTLTLAAMNVNGFTGGSTDELRKNVITGNVTFSEAATNTGSVYVGENIINGTASFTSNAAATWYESYTGSDIYNGNVDFNRSAATGTFNISYHDTTYANQNLVFNSTAGFDINSSIEFGGSTNASIEQLGTQPISMPRLIIKKTGGANLTLNDSVSVTTTTSFISGNVVTGIDKHLIFSDNAVHTGASVASHVAGPVTKTGDDAFTFPVGTPTSLNTVAMTAPAGVTSKFSAEYFNANPAVAGYDTSQHAVTIQKISGCEYWDVKRLIGTSSSTLTFSFAAPCAGGPGYISNPLAVRIARWTGSTWENLGNGGSTGTTTGTVTTAAAVTNFSPFTFGSADLLQSPLPVKFRNVKAYQQGSGIKIDWSNFTESDLVNYTVERSADGQTFTPLSTVNPTLNNGSRADYYYFDAAPFNGINFYRIQSLETGGKKLYSAIVKVDTKGNKIDLTVYPNPVTDGQLLLQTPDFKRGSYTVTVINAVGQQVYSKSLNHSGGLVTESIQLPASLKPGIYNLQMSGDNIKLTKTFLVQ